MRAWASAALLCLAACGYVVEDYPKGEIPFDPARPDIAPIVDAPVYAGANPLVIEAQSRYRTGLDLHTQFIMRSCGGVNGVCHNQKEYPDMHTAANFAAIVGAPCNLQPGSWSTVFDRCERTGDLFGIEGRGFTPIEVGYLEHVQANGTAVAVLIDKSTAPGLHIHLRTALPGSVDDGGFTAEFIRKSGGTLYAFARFRGDWWISEDRKHIMTELDEDDTGELLALLAAGVVQGDANRNGIFGATSVNPAHLLKAGKPEESYLVGRLRGQMGVDKVPGSRMPLANQPPSVPDMLAMMCFIEQLNPTGPQKNIGSGINYNTCSYSADPAALNLVGAGITWNGRIKPLFTAYCSGCHGGATPAQQLDILSYAQLMAPSKQQPGVKVIQPGQPDKSYLWLKISGDGSISGQKMPPGASSQLPADALQDIESWILYGALEDG